MAETRYSAVVIGASAGGTYALQQILPRLPANFPLPIIIAQHLHPLQDGLAIIHYNGTSALTIKDADEKEALCPGFVYFAPPNYHLLIEADHTFSLSIDPKVNYSRPSIDVLFESAATVYGSRLVAILLTGANNDGAQGLRLIKEKGGLIIVQNPQSAEFPFMPAAALKVIQPDFMLDLAEIGYWLEKLAQP
jgi:two-component system, chemotaxis family, protein-glutamate methylesterase/glutaminase